jgi:hypothetical protein
VITDQKVVGLTVSGPGVGAREERVLGGHKYWVMPVAAIPAGGTLTFTLSGLPSTPNGGRIASGILSLMMIGGTVLFARRPHGGAGGKRASIVEERARLVEKREALFTELVSMERKARATETPIAAGQREQVVARLERVYQDIAALDEPRAA